jgi:carotenoid cleavage dioxygenase
MEAMLLVEAVPALHPMHQSTLRRLNVVGGHIATNPAGAAEQTEEQAEQKWVPGQEFLEGNFGPVRKEIENTPLSPDVGSMPTDLRGMYIRNGPNPQFELLGKPYHWFDGDGMIHGVVCNGKNAAGSAVYSNKWIRTNRFERDAKLGPDGYCGEIGVQIMDGINRAFEQPSDKSAVANATARKTDPRDGSRLGKANTALVQHSGRFYALEEGDAPYQVQLPEMSTVGKHTFNGKLRHNFTAHPKVDPVTKEMIFFGYHSSEPLV